MHLLQNNLIFFALIIFILFLPGYFLLLAIFGKNKTVSSLERFILSFGLSTISVDFIFFAYSKLNIRITRPSAIIGIAAFIGASYLIYRLRLVYGKKNGEDVENNLFSFSKNQVILILLLIFFSVFIKTAYLTGSILPTSTDMGHHMYWSKWMADNGQLPTYEGMPDFIIGEHIIFGLFNLIGGLDFFSAFPPLLLFLINILGILTVFVLTLRVFKQKNIAILVLLFLGVLYAVSSPQAKFVSGGVVGNILGNFLMPLAFYFYYRAFSAIGEESNGETSADLQISRIFLTLAIFTTFGLFYTHHLTAFIFLFVVFAIFFVFFIANRKNALDLTKKMAALIFSPRVFLVFFLGIVFFFFVFTPNYVKTSAVETAVGTPEKNTRVGLSFQNIESTVGAPRLALAFLGIIVLFLGYKKNNPGYSLILAWSVMLFIMSVKPNWLFIDLPSNRIGNYITYPLSVLGALSFSSIFKNHNNILVGFLIKTSFILILLFVFLGGISDSADAFKTTLEIKESSQTFSASRYLAETTTADDAILKDHNYLSSDAWMKLFFMRGYKYPLSRGYFKRYEDSLNAREMCTLYMISNPGNKNAKNCFQETNTKFIVINPFYDGAQFQKLKNFNQIFMSNNVAIYQRIGD
jgi:uncharacterized membrane protein